MTDTSIRLSSEVRDRLRAEKEGGETYDEVLERLLSEEQRNATGSGEPVTDDEM